MAKTYGELILEYQNFEYSKESYELTKECYELNLIGKFVESQQFISDNIIDIRNEYNEFDESYFEESASDDKVNILLEAAEEKSKNIFKRIWRGIKKIFKRIKGFFLKLFGKSKKTTDKNDELLEFVEKLKMVHDGAVLVVGGAGLGLKALIGEDDIFDRNIENEKSKSKEEPPVEKGQPEPEQPKESKKEESKKDEPKNEEKVTKPESAKVPSKHESAPKQDNKAESNKKVENNEKGKDLINIKDILESCWKDEYKNAGYDISLNQPYARNINNKNLHKPKNRRLLSMIAAAISTTEVLISVNQNDKKILSFDDLLFVFEYISELNEDSSDKEVGEVKKYISDGIAKSKSKGVTVKVDPKSLDEFKVKLEEISSKMDSLLKESVDGEEDIDLDMFIEASVRDKKRQKKANNKINGGPKAKDGGGKKMGFDEFKNGGYKEIIKSVNGLKDVYSDIMAISANTMNLYNYVENYRSAVGTKLSAALDKYRVKK